MIIDRTSFRPATTTDASLGADLIYSSMSRLADYLDGSGKPQAAKRFLTGLFVRRNNRFSHEFTDVAEADGEAMGLLLSYPGPALQMLDLAMAPQLLAITGWIAFLRFVRNALPLTRVKEANANDYFINTLAIIPRFQRKGVGAWLLARAEDKARGAGFGFCTLVVDVENASARRLYDHTGYQIAETFRSRLLHSRIGHQGFHRMTKALS